ncbi:BBP7 family outer membrane beta-barrel protein [Anatilimnocola sp. NA78]|uniref:BBP7 family outer membrane beta-barrel protein n=1 Tax=Anatilimnocola sp. NA78 TaxID=3415683 RepID=UPI003CE5AFDD
MRPSIKLTVLLLAGWLALVAGTGMTAWAQTLGASRPGASPGAMPQRRSNPTPPARRGSTTQAAFQETAPAETAPAEPPAELPAPAQAPASPASPSDNSTYYAPEQEQYFDDGSFAGHDPGYGNYCGPTGCGVFGGLWVRGEYLLWDMKGMNTPPLVISSTVDNIDPVNLHLNDNGDLGATSPIFILFGGNTINGDVRSGAKLSAGVWLDNCQSIGLEGDYWALSDGDESFYRNSNGSPILARPFYNVLSGLESSEVVAFPTPINGVDHSGLIDIDSSTRFQGAGARAIINLGCNSGCGTSWWNGCPMPTAGRCDLIVGYRYMRLDDSLRIIERSNLDPGGDFDITDSFDTENTFNGIDFGFRLQHQRGCCSVELLSKIALGNTHSQVDIDGSTIITPTGAASQQFVGGILAQRTNIGRYTQDEFAVVPELGLTLGYELNPCWKLTAGYTWLYWSRVARAGDQIDRNVNPDLIPEEADPPADSHLSPRFRFVHDDFWAHGLRLGVEANW